MLKKKKEVGNNKQKKAKLEHIITRFLFGLVFVLIIVCLLGIMFSMKSFSKDMREQILTDVTSNDVLELKKDIPDIAKSINSLLEPYSMAINILSKDQDLRYLPSSSPEDLSKASYSKTTLKTVLESNEDIDLIYMALPDSSIYLDPAVNLPNDFNAVERGWYKKAVENKGETVWEGPYIDLISKKPVVTIAKTVLNDQGGIIGVIAADVQLDSIAQTVKDKEIGSGGYLVLANSEGTILSAPDNLGEHLTVGESFPIDDVREFASSNEEFFEPVEEVHDNNESHYVAAYNLSDVNLTVIGVLPNTQAIAFSDNLIDKAVSSLNGAFILIIALLIVAATVLIIVVRRSIRKLVNPIITVTDAVTGLAIGEYDRFLPDTDNDTELGYLIRATSTVQEGLGSIVRNVANTTDGLGNISSNLDTTMVTISAAFNDISSAINQIAEGTTSQAMDVEDTTNLIMSISEEIEHISELSQNLAQSADEVNKVRTKSVATMEELSASSDATKEEFARVSEDVNRLIESANQVTDSARIIEDINEQTHLLSLNASIEAARAGEAGNGFAVVADEIRKLSENVLLSTKEINENISDIHKQIDGVVSKIGSLDEVINLQSKASHDVEESFDQIGQALDIIRTKIDESDKAVQNVIESKDEATERMQNISVVIEEIAASSEEVSAVSESQNNNIKEVDGIVQDLVNQYDVLSDNLESLGYKRNE